MEEITWASVWCSVTGTSHITTALPCQDSSEVKILDGTNFIIAVVSDGAGSCSNSHIGSSYLAKQAINELEKYLLSSNSDRIESELIWQQIFFDMFKNLKSDLKVEASNRDLDFKSLSATLIVAVSNGEFIACAHIGDGRATYRNANGEWLPMMKPFHGEEANQTVFLTSDYWEDDEDASYFESFYRQEIITGFALLSDGCERSSFKVLDYDQEKQTYFDPNLPYKPFFEPNYSALKLLINKTSSQHELNDLWAKYISSGTKKLLLENDDKTMILSVHLDIDDKK